MSSNGVSTIPVTPSFRSPSVRHFNRGLRRLRGRDSRDLAPMFTGLADLLRPYPVPAPWCDFDFHQVTIDGMPCLGGCAFYYAGDARSTGVRRSPPLGPTPLFSRTLLGETAPVDTLPTDDAKESKRVKSKKRREGRGRSTVRYVTFGDSRLSP